jgi:hypothetical protein
MDTGEMNRLRYRRQYILAPGKIDCPFQGQAHAVSKKYTLYVHIDLPFCKVERETVSLFLLGDLFDYRDPLKGNEEILKDLIGCDFQQLRERISFYSGRFVIVHVWNDRICLLHDAMAARKIYYANHQNELWIASQPHLLARLLNIQHTRDASKILFYQSEVFNTLLHNASIGNTTCYDEIFQLLPNHSLDIRSFQVSRYWPSKTVQFLPTEQVVKKCSEMIRGYMESIVNRYKVMLPVTAGKDSRMLLAGSFNCREKIFFYLNKEAGIDNRNPDLNMPTRLFKRLDLPFNLLNPYPEIDPDFKAIYFSNNPYGSKKFLPHIYNYYKNFSDRVNLPGNIASAGYELYTHKKMKISAESLAHLNNVGNYGYAKAYYEKWLRESREVCAAHNMTLLHLFYWEERMGNWGTQVQMDKDIAQEDFNLFNSRQLIELFLSVPRNYLERPDFRLQREIINHMWPEVLLVPINPSAQKKIMKILKFMGMLDFFQKLQYNITLRDKRNRSMHFA